GDYFFGLIFLDLDPSDERVSSAWLQPFESKFSEIFRLIHAPSTYIVKPSQAASPTLSRFTLNIILPF
ncbi:MAG: hypothetical protein ABGX43_05800, partial [Nitrospinaceae bacterium]